MRRFCWPLQRVLDVSTQRELALRSELIALMQQITRHRQEIIRRRAVVRLMLSDIRDQATQRRIVLQEVFMSTVEWDQRRTRTLQDEIDRLTAERSDKTAQLVKLRKATGTLERLRSEALAEHLRLESRQEQKQFDETAQIAFARRMARSRQGQEAGV